MAPDTVAPSADPAPRVDRSLWKIGLITALVASAANVIVYGAARAAGVPLELTEVFDDSFQRMSVASFILATLLEGGVVATAVAAGCRRWLRHPRFSFIPLAVVGTVGSFALPVTSDGTASTKVVLCLTHFVAALIIVPALAVSLPRHRHQTSPLD